MIDRKSKSYEIACGSCKKARFVTYSQAWNIRVGNSSGDCKGCTNTTPWNKGKRGVQVAWNKGLVGFMAGHRPFNTKPNFLGHKHTKESKEKMRVAKLGKVGPTLGKRWILSEETKERVNLRRPKGEGHYKWKKDRSTLAKKQERNDSAYKEWRRLVWLRDNFVCKIANPDCSGRIEAHHILGWSEYPELRYEIKNGITLCHAHHPKRRAEEKRLSPYFQELVSAL